MIGAMGFIAIYEPEESEPRILKEVAETGTNAVPKLLKLLKSRDSALRKKLIALNQKQSLIKLDIHSASDDYDLANRGFRSLGTNAAFVAPELIRLFLATGSGKSREALHDIFVSIGPAALETLYSAFTNESSTNHELRCWELAVLWDTETNYEKLMPIFVTALKDTDANVRAWAALDLIQMKTNGSSKLVLPALLIATTDTNQEVSKLAIRALEHIDTNAATRAGFK